MTEPCKRDWEIDAVLEGRLGASDEHSFHAHRAVCASCRQRYARDAALRMAGRALPVPAPNELDLRRVRQGVLRTFATRERRTARGPHTLVAAAALLALLALLGLLVGGRALRRPNRPSSAPLASVAAPHATASAAPVASAVQPALAGTVTADPSARYTQVRDGDVERVVLERGTASIHVRHRVGAERFLVNLPDGQLEVRGTTFVVTVRGGATVEVKVIEGLVALRLADMPERRLGAGESWRRSVGSGAPIHAKPAADTTATAKVAKRADDAYEHAVALLGAHRYAEAASAFHDLLRAHPTAPEAEDAAFLEAVALSRAGRATEAAARARAFLATYPRSFHRAELEQLDARDAGE